MVTMLAAVALLAGQLFPPGGAGQGTLLARPLSEDLVTDLRQRAVHPAFSPDGRSIVYAADEDDRRRALWIIEPSGGKPPVRLTRGESRDDYPRFTPDGSAVVYSSDRSGRFKVCELVLATGQEVALTEGPGDDLHPVPSHSGRYVAFDSDRAGNYDVWVLDRATGRLYRVTDDPGPDFHPTWSPDDREIAWTSSAGGRFDIWVRRLVRGSQSRRLTSGEGHNAHPDWSRRGLIAFDADVRGAAKVMVVDPATTGPPIAVTQGTALEEFARWSPDGATIACQVKVNGMTGIQVRAVPWARQRAAAPRAPQAARSADPSAMLVRRPRIRIVGDAAPGAEGGDRPSIPMSNSGPDGARGGPAIRDRFPQDDPAGVPAEAAIAVVFDGALDSSQDPDPFVVVEEDGTRVPGSAVYNPLLRRLDIAPARALKAGSRVRVTVKAGLRDNGGTPLARDFAWGFRIAGPDRPPVVMSYHHVPEAFDVATGRPGRNKRNVPLDAHVEVELTHALDMTTTGDDALKLHDSRGNLVAGEVVFPPGDRTIVLRPYQRLVDGRAYTVTLSSRLRSRQGRPLPAASTRWIFTTAYAQPFAVTDFSPVRITRARERITIRFNRPVAPDSLARGDAVMVAGTRRLRGHLSMGPTADSVVFEPIEGLDGGGAAVLLLPVGLCDHAQNPLKAGPRLAFEVGLTPLATERAVTRALGRMGRAADPVRQARQALRRHAPRPTVRPLASYRFPRGAGPTRADSSQVPDWARDGLRRLARHGYLGEDTTQEGLSGLTRYRAAALVDRARRAAPLMTAVDRAILERLLRQFHPERAALGLENPTAPGDVAAPARGGRPGKGAMAGRRGAGPRDAPARRGRAGRGRI